MTRIINIIRALLVTVLVLAVIVPGLLYILLSMSPVQSWLREVGERELSELLGAQVEIGEVGISPFNKVVLKDVAVIVEPCDTALTVDRLGGGIMLWKLIAEHKPVFSYAEILGLDARLWRDSLSAPLNIQPVIDKLSKKDKTSPSAQYDLRINNIVIRGSRFSYDVMSEPTRQGHFDPHHIHVSDLKADVLLPRIKNDDYIVDLKRIALDESSGFSIESLSGLFHVSDSAATVTGLRLELPGSRLSFEPIDTRYQGWSGLANGYDVLPVHIALTDGSYISTDDIAYFVPAVTDMGMVLDIDADMEGYVSDFDIRKLAVTSERHGFNFSTSGHVKGLPDMKAATVDLPNLKIDAGARLLPEILAHIPSIGEKQSRIVSEVGAVHVTGSLHGSLDKAEGTLDVATDIGRVLLAADYTELQHGNASIKSTAAIETVDAGKLSGNPEIGTVTAHVEASGNLSPRGYKGQIAMIVDEASFKGYHYNNAHVDLDVDGKNLKGQVSIDDENIGVTADGTVNMTKGEYACDVNVDIDRLNPYALGLTKKYEGYRLSGEFYADLAGDDVESMDGRAELSHLRFLKGDQEGVALNHLTLMASGSSMPQYIMVHSDIFDAQINGNYRFKDIVPSVRHILTDIFPALHTEINPDKKHLAERRANFDLRLEIKENETTNAWLKFIKSPVRVLHPVNATFALRDTSEILALTLKAPSLLQKDKFIDSTEINVSLDGRNRTGNLVVGTLYPTKNGIADVNLSASGTVDRIGTDASWNIAGKRKFSGAVSLSTLFSRDENDRLCSLTDIMQSEVVLNDTTWTVHPASVAALPDKVVVSDVDISRDNQYIKINGTASANPDDEICLQLLDINLDYIFETLNIGNVMFGGVATGDFYASGLYGKEPRLYTPGLHVDRISYNGATLGDADITSRWDNDNKGVDITAVIKQPNERTSYIDGTIYPMAEALDFRFKADKLDVRFMKPYMEAFTSDVSGYASGDARLYGTFKLIDLTGEIYAEDLRLKLDFTNTYYTTTDSVHITPGRIAFNDVVLRDMYGNTAHLDGWVTHHCFKEPSFEFNVSDARDFLCFDVNDKINPVWYGRVFCNGSAFIKGVPGFIDMNVNISTAPRSVFTFVLSDSEAANEYTFMTFRDRDEIKDELLLSVEDPRAAAVKRLKDYYARLNKEESSSSVYRMNLQVDATPDGEMILLMDPVGGDKIKARGNGNLRIEYNSALDDMRMFGTYTLSQGSYNFTLQDIIIKDFIIKPGSSISFHGDPLAASLDIQAIYSVNANLSDLDESFLQDRELNRTNVPVHALLKVTGDMRQPDINFDLEFPTLTQDTYRKVRSIVSTEDMMNRQIIYLLALNRFYTPDYMGATTKGNELVSVASSTISSQLTSMLGQLSDNWNIAPNFRSDKGDFSDMEVDLALSSYLLNNRLLFNGNFGYRDKALNNNSFVGDFDIEYLLNKSGNIRLKAYNRYNDQTFYVKSALTTQGVGIMFRRDFDNLFRWLRPKKKRKEAKQSAVGNDSVPEIQQAQPTDTISPSKGTIIF